MVCVFFFKELKREMVFNLKKSNFLICFEYKHKLYELGLDFSLDTHFTECHRYITKTICVKISFTVITYKIISFI